MLLTSKLFVHGESPTQRVWYTLIGCAHKNKTINYWDLQKAAGSNLSMPDLFIALTKIGDLEQKNDRPWLNVLAVGHDEKPGPGFFTWSKKYFDAIQLKKHSDEYIFDLVKQSCYEFWSDESTFLKFKDLILF